MASKHRFRQPWHGPVRGSHPFCRGASLTQSHAKSVLQHPATYNCLGTWLKVDYTHHKMSVDERVSKGANAVCVQSSSNAASAVSPGKNERL